MKIVSQLLLCVLIAVSCNHKSVPQTTSTPSNLKQETVVAPKKSETTNQVEVIPPTSTPVIPPQKMPLDPSVRYGTLPNGMKYYIKHNKKPENRVELRLAVNAGAMQEDETQKGLAHFVEHMAFNGSDHFKKNDLINFLEGLGVKFGAHLNAYTSFDETVYMLQLPTDKQETIDKGLLVIEDWASGLSFDPNEIDKERGVVVSEWRSGLGPDRRLLYQFLPKYYYQSRYTERLPIGDTAILKNAPYERFTSFYKDWYRPNLMAIAIVGDVNVDSMELEIKNRFTKLKNPDNSRPKIEYELPKHQQTLISICTDEEATFAKAYLIYKHPKQDNTTILGFKKYLANQLINEMINMRWAEMAQNPNAPFVQASSSYGQETRKNDVFESFVFIKKGKYIEALSAMITENERLSKFGFNEPELSLAKINLLKSLEDAKNEKDKTESRLLVNEYVAHFLRDIPSPGIDIEFAFAQKMLPLITLSELNQAIKEYITEENRVIVLTAPESEKVNLPSEQQILDLFTQVKQQPIKPYESKVVNEPLITQELKGSKVTTKQVDNTYAITTYTLANGATIKVKPTIFKNDEILFSAYSHGGASLYTDEQFMSVDFSNAIVSESGVGKFDKITLQKMLAGKTVEVSPYIGDLDEGFQGSCSPKDLESLLQLVYLYHTQPRKSADDFTTFMTQQHAIYDNILLNPQYYFLNKFQEVMFKNSIRRGLPTKTKLDKIKLEEAYTYYNERFANAADFTYFFVGNFDEAIHLPLIEKYIGSLPTTTNRENWKDPKIIKPIGKIVDQIEMGNTPKTFVGIQYHGEAKHSDIEELHFDALVKVLNIMLRESLREDKGGVYGVGVQGSLVAIPNQRFALNITFNADPPKAQELIDLVKYNLDSIMKYGTDIVKLNKVKETFKRDFETNQKENNFWLGLMIKSVQHNWNINNIEKYIATVDTISLETIKTMAQKYLSTDNTILVTLSPKKE